MSAMSTTINFHTLVATDAVMPPASFHDVSIEITPEIESGITKRWPEDESRPIVASSRGPDTLKRFLLEIDPDIAEDMGNQFSQPFWLDGWTEQWQSYASYWSWRWPFYHPARTVQDPDYPWIHWYWVVRIENGLLVTVREKRVALLDEGGTIDMENGGFFMSKHGPPA